jgi:hypothetical protein
VLSARAVPRSCKEDNWDKQVSSVRESVKKRDNCKGHAVQRVFGRESRELAVIRSRYQATISGEPAG